ncbi:endoribonuclease Dcr-1-like isoform X2 [Dermacentor albipictus]|uniref:endoribonuclease Dcr-1-like isoform X2 n=1 Tax=Dermacentor albipictus TaxID=60249 RepID=UPI0038FC88E2
MPPCAHNGSGTVPPAPAASSTAMASKVSGGFLGWTRPVPPEQWDAQSPILLQAAQAYREVEEAINYTFRDKGFLVQAFTHSSYPTSSRVVPGYMRPMDFLGDAMIKSLLTTQLYGCLHPLGPGTLTKARASLECNRRFGFVVARHGWQRLFRVGSPALSEAIVEVTQPRTGRALRSRWPTCSSLWRAPSIWTRTKTWPPCGAPCTRC